jgi:hypothetical protein
MKGKFSSYLAGYYQILKKAGPVMPSGKVERPGPEPFCEKQD